MCVHHPQQQQSTSQKNSTRKTTKPHSTRVEDTQIKKTAYPKIKSKYRKLNTKPRKWISTKGKQPPIHETAAGPRKLQQKRKGKKTSKHGKQVAHKVKHNKELNQQ